MKCLCGCGKETKKAKRTNAADGVVRGEPNLYILGHGFRKTTPPFRKTKRGCWSWSRYVGNNGYGSAWKNGRMHPAHRVYYEATKGKIPPGLQLDHLCRNRRCVNPEHLEVVTHAENSRRGKNVHLTAKIAGEIRKRLARGETQMALANEFSVSQPTISAIKIKRIWRI